MIEPEIAFADISDDAAMAERILKFTLKKLLDECQEDLAFFDQRVEKGLLTKLQGIVTSEFVRMDYGEAMGVLERAKETFEFPVNLQSEHERYLTEKYAKRPVIVTNYPKDIKAFYMRVNDDGRTVAAMDVLAPGIGEIIVGSQREERLEVLDARMVAHRAMEIGAHHQRHRTAASGVQAAHQDPDRAALGRDGSMLFWALLASGQIVLRKVDGWMSITQPLAEPIDLAA
jgi:aspartyl/asparaginyl-tRNA synthetase